MREYEIERSIDIEAPRERILELLTSFREWRRWSPFEQETELDRAYRGPDRGVGAIYDYRGKRSGAGTLEITDVRDDVVHVQVSFRKPFKNVTQHAFELRPLGDAMHVTWRMVGQHTALTKLVFPAEKVLGPVFEQGLAQLKGVAEG